LIIKCHANYDIKEKQRGERLFPGDIYRQRYTLLTHKFRELNLNKTSNMLRFVFSSLLFLFSSLLTVHGLAIINDTQSFNTTAFLLSVVEEHQEPSAFVVPNQRSLADGTVNTNIFTLFIYNGSQIYVYSAFANENEHKFDPHRYSTMFRLWHRCKHRKMTYGCGQ
jgi:hypothetical protein